MSKFRVHAQNPSDAVEQAFFRIQHERMADVPILNPALRVEAVDFQRWQGQWLGIVVTPWCMSVLQVPASADTWMAAAGNTRRFVEFPYGQLAVLASHEPELGEFQSCALFSPMDKFGSQAQAVATARASLLALLAPPAINGSSKGPVLSSSKGSGRTENGNASRRRFLGLGSAPAENTPT